VPGAATIRPYQPADRAAVRRIAFDTALFGDPIRALVPDAELFADLWTAAYTDGLPLEALVAADADSVLGYLLGAPDDAATARAYLARVAPLLASRAAHGEYRALGPSLRGLARLALDPAPRAPAGYPAHLHLNLVPAARGLGLGRALLGAYLERLAARGTRGVHLSTTDRNGAALRLYERSGFSVAARRETRAYRGVVDGPVVRLVMVRAVSGAGASSARAAAQRGAADAVPTYRR
jgi:ribosomal protein S18 acetylase RimI-like enzyme